MPWHMSENDLAATVRPVTDYLRSADWGWGYALWDEERENEWNFLARMDDREDDDWPPETASPPSLLFTPPW